MDIHAWLRHTVDRRSPDRCTTSATDAEQQDLNHHNLSRILVRDSTLALHGRIEPAADNLLYSQAQSEGARDEDPLHRHERYPRQRRPLHMQSYDRSKDAPQSFTTSTAAYDLNGDALETDVVAQQDVHSSSSRRYRRRPRHKTKHDKYELKTTKKTKRKDEAARQKPSKLTHKPRRGHREEASLGIVRAFELNSKTRKRRLTVSVFFLA